jgi:Protein of unknown function (DUF3142)
MPRVYRFILGLSCVIACGSHLRAQLPHEAYIWQGQWTPALVSAVEEGKSTFRGFRVNAGEVSARGSIVLRSPDYDALAKAKLPVTAVLRMRSAIAQDVEDIRRNVRKIAAAWPQRGIVLAGIELDHDCATAKLSEYARALGELRVDWPRNLRLSITALPAWMDAPQLRDVLAQVDESVLQVHAVRDPATGLFDRNLAWRWLRQYSAISAKPFHVALPAYGVRASFDERGRAVAVEAEMRRADAGAFARELTVGPGEVAALLGTLEAEPLPNLAGVVWFRLPSTDDRRAWSLETLRAVITAAPLVTRLEARTELSAAGAHDVILDNRGTLDAPIPATIVQARDCSAADAVNGFSTQAAAQGWRFAAPPDAVLRANRELRIGWIHCAIVDKVTLDEAP